MRALSSAPKPGSGESLRNEQVSQFSISLTFGFHKLNKDPGRTPSTSPPPAPPAVEYVELHLAPLPSPIR